MANLFDHAAERLALGSGRPLSQELAELKGAPNAAALPAEGLFRPCGDPCPGPGPLGSCEKAPGHEGQHLSRVPFGRWWQNRREDSLAGKIEQRCRDCGAIFIAAPRADSTCNLCRRNAACADCGSAHGPNGACGGGF